MKARYKFILFLVSAISAVALCALPFFAGHKNIVYVYTKQNAVDKREQDFISELKHIGYYIQLNSPKLPAKEDIVIWFRSPEFAKEIANSPAQYNFLYSDAYYPFDWYGMQKYPVMLTPYQDLYEHYMRANIKSAVFQFDTTAPKLAATRFHQLLMWLKENQ